MSTGHVPKRDHITGRFDHDGDFDRMCVCGHTLGIHVDGGWDCINADVGDGAQCACVKFRQSRAKAHHRSKRGASGC